MSYVHRKFVNRTIESLVMALMMPLLVLALCLVPRTGFHAEEPADPALERIATTLKFLAADEQEGRGIGTSGINRAADFIAAQFSQMGLRTKIVGDSPFQVFSLMANTEIGPDEKNYLRFDGPSKDGQAESIVFRLRGDFTPLAVGGSAELQGRPLVFAGYGITAKEKKPSSEEVVEYDDYRGLDVKDKVVILIRREPQQNDPQSIFNGNRPSRHAEFRTKIANAFEHGAAAVLMVNDDLGVKQRVHSDEKAWNDAIEKMAKVNAEFRGLESPNAEQIKKYRAQMIELAAQVQQLGKQFEEAGDQLIPFTGAGEEGTHRKMPVLFGRRALVDGLIKRAIGKDLATIEQEIDQTLVPQSHLLAGWSATVGAEVKVNFADVKNVIGVLDGEGPLADETVVVGAHYDHLGMGGTGSLAPWTRATHNGADDNGSGTAAMIEIAHRLATAGKKPRRRVVFIAFTAEERGLLGSRHYVREPLFPLEKTVAMVNLDMVGRLKDDKLIVYGTGSAVEFDGMLEELNKKYAFQLTKHATGFGPSDQASFFEKKIPVFHFFTGLHEEYHRPSDDFELINLPGMCRVTAMASEIVSQIIEADAPPTYQDTNATRNAALGEGSRPLFGAVPEEAANVEGVKLGEILKGGPAEQAGLKSGDVVVQFGDSKVGRFADFNRALRKHKPGDEVSTVVKRGEESVSVTVKLGEPR